jgi:hypothetical protein
MKLTLPCEPGAGVTRTSIARSTSSISARVRVLVEAIADRQPAQLGQIGNHFRPDFKARDDVAVAGPLSGSPHSERGGRQWSHL